MSVFEVPTYVTTVPLPAPITSGSGLQSYTDPIGDVWVAANGVRGGNWYRARDVLHCRYVKNAALTLTAGGWTNVTMDGLVFDDYGLYSTSNGLFTPLIVGMWQLVMSGSANATANSQYLQPSIWETSPSGQLCQAFIQSGVTTGAGLCVQTLATKRFTSTTDTHYCRIACSTALPLQQNMGNYFEAHYLGTG